MVKKIGMVITLWVIIQGTFAQKTPNANISGIVKTTDGEAVEYISVFLKNTTYDQIRLITSDTNTSDQMYHNIDKYRTTGISLENTLVLNRLTAEVAFSYTGRYNRLADREEYASEKQDKMRYSPEVSASCSYKWNKVATFNLFYKYTGKRSEYKEYTDNNQNTYLGLGERAGYHWADLTVSRPIGQYIQVSGGVRNLFDLSRLDNTLTSSGHGASTSNQTLLACGRSYFIGLSFNFNK